MQATTTAGDLLLRTRLDKNETKTFRSVMQDKAIAQGSTRQIYEGLKPKMSSHPFMKRYTEMGIKEGLFSDSTGALGPLGIVLFGIVFFLAVSTLDGDCVALSTAIRGGRRKGRRRNGSDRPNRRPSGCIRGEAAIWWSARFRCNSAWSDADVRHHRAYPGHDLSRRIGMVRLPPRSEGPPGGCLIASLVYLPAVLAVFLLGL